MTEQKELPLVELLRQLQSRLQAMCDCENSMCCHCIEILCQDAMPMLEAAITGTPICPFCDSGLVLTEQEADAIADLSQRLELRPATVIKQALRGFQLQAVGEPDLGKKADAIHGEVPAAASTEAQDERK